MKKKPSEKYDHKIIEALQKLPKQIEDKRHGFVIEVKDDRSRSNETRFQHIAKKAHLLKVRDIEAISEGVKDYIRFSKSMSLKDTYYYYIRRSGNDKGFIQLAIKLIEGEKKKYYIKTIFIAYRINNC